MTRLILGRYYCPQCKRVAVVVREAEVVEVRCPKCETLAVPCSGVAGWQDK